MDLIYFQIRARWFLSAGNLGHLITQAAFLVTFAWPRSSCSSWVRLNCPWAYNAALGAVVTLWILSGAHRRLVGRLVGGLASAPATGP